MRRQIATGVLVGVMLYVICYLPISAQGPMLQNGDFEDGFTVRESQEVEVAVDWEYDYMSVNNRYSSWCHDPCYRPEYKPETQIAVGGTSQRWFTTFAHQFGTIHQLVGVDADQWYTFSCEVYAISEPDGQLAVLVGINPWGAGVFDRTMIWGEQQPWGSNREWNTLSVTARAYGGRIRVAVGGNNNYPTKNNAVYVDNCSLKLASGPAQPTPTPPPTYTPYPTATPMPTPEPCPTCPAGQGCDYGVIRGIVREELDATTWGSVP